MPVNCVYFYDNFFQKVTNMESPRKNNDCYFYYYSTCSKGDKCTFRHEPSALGCETVCSFWKEGKCLNVQCNFRHMELRKNRKAIPCYWETQPGGCLKSFCPFMHKSNKEGECEPLGVNELDSSALSSVPGQSSSQGIDIEGTQNLTNQYSEPKYGNATVDPLVVKFEEESDNESAPTNSPAKSVHTRVVKVKTLEEIRLEKIQAESAAYYFYPGVEELASETPTSNGADLRQRIINRITVKPHDDTPSDFEILSLDEIRKKRKLQYTKDDNDSYVKDTHKKQKLVINKNSPQDLGNVKIKTLEEIREERLQRLKEENVVSTNTVPQNQIEDACPEVTSTSTEEVVDDSANNIKLKRLKRKTSISIIENIPRKLRCIKSQNKDLPNKQLEQPDVDNKQIPEVTIELTKGPVKLESESNKLEDILLLDDDDLEDSNVTLTGEDDVLKDIDDLLNE